MVKQALKFNSAMRQGLNIFNIFLTFDAQRLSERISSNFKFWEYHVDSFSHFFNMHRIFGLLLLNVENLLLVHHLFTSKI